MTGTLIRRTFYALLLAGVCIWPALGADAPAANPAIEPKADALLKQMSQTLAAAKNITFQAHAITEESLASGQKVEFARNQSVFIRRPDGLAATVKGDVESFAAYYDGKVFTLHNLTTHAYGRIDSPATIDATLDTLANKYGMVVPLADLVTANPYEALTEHVNSGTYLGLGWVFDVQCHHLAFRQEGIDWQIWIDAGQSAVPRKMVITFKDTPGHLQYTAYLNKWDLAANIPASTFQFTPPADAKMVEFVTSATRPAQ